MNEMIAFCGLDCYQCGAFIATIENDDVKRREVAEQWSKEFKADIQPQDINCDGCVTDSEVIFKHCHVCEIRKCGRAKAIGNCAYCGEYACDKLEGFFSMVPEAKTRLDKVKAEL